MAHTKAGGTAKNLTDSNAQYLGIKLYDGEKAKIGAILVKQRGTRILPGENVGLAKDHSLFALSEGIVKYTERRKNGFNNRITKKKIANIVTK